jgi:hypothetical protein
MRRRRAARRHDATPRRRLAAARRSSTPRLGLGFTPLMMICYSACGIAGSCSHRVPTRVKENEQSTAAWQAINAIGACEARMATPPQNPRAMIAH